MQNDANGRPLTVGDHVFIPARISSIDTSGNLTLTPDHPPQAARRSHESEVAEWKKTYGAEKEPSAKMLKDNPCPQLSPGGSTLTGLDAGQVEFHSR